MNSCAARGHDHLHVLAALHQRRGQFSGFVCRDAAA